ncbi:MAG: metal ABC transporter permease [Acidithiobacillus ferriphilus]|jgi:ABC-type Mn2+/Zn2+ transport systems, permease components|uniref:metal ABC transporter permease n=1 Tax=Acidithiobacillus ferriphilus TaxID=1689834 RepID=UPI001C0630D0|nr:metal ABC transporter permease [Acidithiobacillus ferriphilus]MBU2784420.1 metal ABC transporter permease [Acidithiobacillus ferriphilus]MBU2828181.1 metal ABC transporter permease [Acidithiobacillus ferriphilus]MBU2846019.1 metal ABC transporter permease [Acidithiobacillus ferriphilus]MEB8474354.1 metal ABC transporter permease [Acidithiobacillus ferriphilus]UEP59423.1 metal ABC transporter permease [Acidithiobacillus ferriphilus]
MWNLWILLGNSGFFRSEPVQTALIVGTCAALVSALIGMFTVLRGNAFAGHALADVSSAGGAASLLLGVSPLLGFLGMAWIAAFGMEFLGVRKVRERDLATGIVLGAGLGLSALLLYLDVTTTSTTGAAVSVMFGSMFAIPRSLVGPALMASAAVFLLAGLLYRPMLLTAVDPDLAAARGISPRWIGLLQLLTLGLAVAVCALAIGAVLATALLIGPAGAAIRLSRRPAQAIFWASVIGLTAVWGGIWMAYESYYWFSGNAWPVSFFVVTLVFLFYLVAVLVARVTGLSARPKPVIWPHCEA